MEGVGGEAQLRVRLSSRDGLASPPTPHFTGFHNEFGSPFSHGL